jgi:tetratricopeptide (TPR) repeat protein
LGIDGDCEDWLKAMDLNYSSGETISNLVENCGYTKEDFYSNSDWYSLADKEFLNENYLKAIEYYDKSILLPGVDEDDYFYRGLAYFRINKYEQALKDYYKASELDPGVRQDFRIVQTLIELERDEEAIELFEKDTNETLLTNLYLDETKKEFDTKHIIEFTDYYYEVSKIRDLILEKTGSSIKERLKYLNIMEDAYIQSFPESSNIVLYLTLNTLDIEDLIEDKFSYIIKLNTIIDLIKNTESEYSKSVAILFEKRGDLKIDIGDKLGACKDYESGLKIIDDEDKNFADRLKEKQLKNCN